MIVLASLVILAPLQGPLDLAAMEADMRRHGATAAEARRTAVAMMGPGGAFNPAIAPRIGTPAAVARRVYPLLKKAGWQKAMRRGLAEWLRLPSAVQNRHLTLLGPMIGTDAYDPGPLVTYEGMLRTIAFYPEPLAAARVDPAKARIARDVNRAQFAPLSMWRSRRRNGGPRLTEAERKASYLKATGAQRLKLDRVWVAFSPAERAALTREAWRLQPMQLLQTQGGMRLTGMTYPEAWQWAAASPEFRIRPSSKFEPLPPHPGNSPTPAQAAAYHRKADPIMARNRARSETDDRNRTTWNKAEDAARLAAIPARVAARIRSLQGR